MTRTTPAPLHVCLTCIELFGDSVYGGFGRATRFVGRELARRGVEVSIVVPRRSTDYPSRYELDGVTVHQYDPYRPWEAIRLFRNIGADVYHSQDTSIGTALAPIARPSAAHVITFRDPMDRGEWQVESAYADMPRVGWVLYRQFITNPFVTLAVRRADGLYCAAKFLAPKAQALYGLRQPPVFLPSPVDLPATVEKADRPTVCYVGRWEGRKRVELFFELARDCPDVEFVALGGARDPVRDRALRERYGGIPNLHLVGVLDQFTDREAWSEAIGRSWILVNTSAREGLPTAFIEAAAHSCAILSFADPDGFATRFGLQAQEGALEDGLRGLLDGNRWAALGGAGRDHAERVFSVDHAIDSHLEAYAAAIGRARRRPTADRATADPEVTIVVTTRDRRRWLERCVDSIHRQEGVSWELVIVDDASSDTTASWLGTLADVRISVIRVDEQSGVPAARNRGLAAARGTYVMFVDDDDWLELGALQTLSSGLEAHPEAVAAVGARRVWFTTENYARRDSHPHVPRLRRIVDELLLGWSAVSGQNLYRTALVRQIGGYDPAVAQVEDRDLWLRIAVLGPVVLRPEIVMTYRVHPGQTRPSDVRELRERTARRAIAELPVGEQAHATRLRRTTHLLDRAEDAFADGSVPAGMVDALRAFVSTPWAFASPLIGPWTFRRLGGRLARRFVLPAKQ